MSIAIAILFIVACIALVIGERNAARNFEQWVDEVRDYDPELFEEMLEDGLIIDPRDQLARSIIAISILAAVIALADLIQ